MKQYFILASFGSAGHAYVERDPVDMDLHSTLADLASKQWDNPVAVVEIDLAAGTCRSMDVTAAGQVVGVVCG